MRSINQSINQNGSDANRSYPQGHEYGIITGVPSSSNLGAAQHMGAVECALATLDRPRGLGLIFRSDRISVSASVE